MRAIVAKSLPRTSATITFRDGYPAMAPTEANRRLAATLNRINRDAGFPVMRLLDPVRRGAADISFVADYVDGLAGLGAEGRDGHTEREAMELKSLPRQIGRAALLIHRLTQAKEVSQAVSDRPVGCAPAEVRAPSGRCRSRSPEPGAE